MAGSKSDWYANRILDHLFGNNSHTPPSTMYVALSTSAFQDSATGSDMNEVGGGGYSRVAVENNSTNWPSASGQEKANGEVFTFPTATGNWGTVQSFYLCESATGGNVYYGADLTTSRTIAEGDTASFAVGSIVIREN